MLGILNGVAQGGGGGGGGGTVLSQGNRWIKKVFVKGIYKKKIGSLTLASSTLKALTANTDVLDILGSSNKQR